MSDIRQLNVGSELNSSSDEDLGIFSGLRKKEHEVLVIRTIEKLIVPVLEPLIRKVVAEQLDSAIERIVNQPSRERPSSSSPIRFKLRFGNKLFLPVVTGKHIVGKDENPLKVELVDENTSLIVKTRPQSSGRVEILALPVNTKIDEEVSNSNTPLLNGCTNLDLNEGIGTIEKISFPQRSKWTTKCKYVLVARFVDEVDGISVVEAKSEVFTLKDKRNRNYEKHYPPILSDKVLHLANIRKGGSYEKQLIDKKITTVKKFLTEYFMNTENLKEILSMPEKKFDGTIKHALTCEELKEKYIYYIPGSEQHEGIVLSIVGELFGLISKSQFVPFDNLLKTQKDEGKKLVASALEHWDDHVVHYNEHLFPSSSSHLVPRDPTLPVAVYDHTQPSILIGSEQIHGEYQSYDHTQPSSSNGKTILPYTPLGTSHGNDICSHTPQITHYANGTPFDIIGKSLTNNGYDHMQPSIHDNFQHWDDHQVAAPEDITPLHDTFSYLFDDMGFGSLDDFQLGSTMSQDFIYDQNFIIDDMLNPDERLQKDMLSKARIKKWLQMFNVMRFSHRMKLENSGHVRKRTRFN